MENQPSPLMHLYHQALVNPKGVALIDFEKLLARYPYSQPLYFALERRRFLDNQSANPIGSRAVLLAGNAGWLAEYVRSPIEEVPVIEVEDDDYVPYEDIETSSDAERHHPLVEESFAVEESEQTEERPDVVTAVEDEGIEDKDILETLVQEGIGGGDYFALHAQEANSEQSEAEEYAQDDISLYNDELMPYSFRWWLHKTRLEHADTYQPFASSELPLANKSSFDPAELERVILDQQIRENIIHLQKTEDKLSDEVKHREAASQGPNKITEVSERFIREEPQIQPTQPENLNVENKARKSSEEQFDLVTETLAGIYSDQAMYVKAIEVYKKLILRFPEKKSYFATRIKELEEKLY